MILVDIYVPSLDETFDFQLDENTQTRFVTDEVEDILGKRVRAQADSYRKRFVLCSFEQQRILPANQSLKMCGIRNGSRLLLV